MDNEQLDDLIKENEPRLRSFVRGKVDNRDDADDIVQDTFYQLLRTIHVLDNPIAHVSSWLYTVAHNLIINHGRKHREESMPVQQSDESFMADLSEIMVANTDDNPDIRMLRSMVWDELDKALEELPQEQHDAIVMTEIKGLSTKEAARQMGCSTATFLSRKHYAVLHIRKRLHTLYSELTQNHNS